MAQQVEIRVQRLSETARVPRVMQDGDVAADLYASDDLVIPPHGRAVVPTGIAIELPPGFRGRIYPRSGLAARHGIDAGAGLIDESYRGSIGVLLFNHSDEPFEVKVGDRIAQFAVEPYVLPAFRIVAAVAATARSGGWGSSGMT
jgi:dUTP pyrophosphatase